MKDIDITVVVFRKFSKKGGGDVIALFPGIEAGGEAYAIQSYMHVGQHGAADHLNVVHMTRPAKPEEYAALKRELESAPYYYNLKVKSRVNYRDCFWTKPK